MLSSRRINDWITCRRKLLASITLALLVMVIWLAAPVGISEAQTKQFHMNRFDADITVNKDGSLEVVETLAYVFDSGTYRRGSRSIPLGQVEGITAVRVEEEGFGAYSETQYNEDNALSGVDRTFGTLRGTNNLYIRWIFSNAGTSESKTFHLSYHVAGAVRVYEQRDELDWYAVPGGWSGPIASSTVHITVPQGVDATKLVTASKPAVIAEAQGDNITWKIRNPTEGLEVGIQFPKGTLQAQKPVWQQAIDDKEKIGSIDPSAPAPIIMIALQSVLPSIVTLILTILHF